MEAYYVKTKQEAVELVRSLMKKGETISCGGSVSLKESGVFALMQSGDYNFLDRSKASGPDEIAEIYRKSFCCDTYLTSSNAVTENGELVNVDGTGNRIAAMSYGPKSVICLVGVNKIVPDIDAAYRRIKEFAAPPNAKRLGLNTPCAKNGICCAIDAPLGVGCADDLRMCAYYVVSAQQRVRGRIKVIICQEELGY